MPTPFEWARHYRSRATECQRLAESVSSLSLQDHYTRLAQGYIALAEAEESSVGHSPKQEQAHSSEGVE